MRRSLGHDAGPAPTSKKGTTEGKKKNLQKIRHIRKREQPVREKKNEDKVGFQRASPLMRVWTKSFGNSKSLKFQKEGSLY